ncbi:MAG: hypothetical protein DID92_2727745395 [Candidatus Nitrotoga sp. SPKER]|nr:MAG: hypothetical protein DID92_2727745395 [Candidatus Nitrotoga sp. SPKER]
MRYTILRYFRALSFKWNPLHKNIGYADKYGQNTLRL